MTPEEIRAHALNAAARWGVGWQMESAPDVIALAKVFARYIAGDPVHPPTSAPAPVTSAPAPGETVESVWGPQCTECTHSAGVHLHSGCTHDGCTCTRSEREASASGVKCIRCAHPAGVHDEDGCTEYRCTCTRTRTPRITLPSAP